MASREQIGDLDAVRLIGMIAQAAATARMHRRNCRQFAQRLKLVGNLLEQLKISELKKYPETREPLEQLEDALRRYFVLVDSCRSYLYLLAMGWSIVSQFRKAQSEIDRYLLIVPLIVWVHNARIRERLEYIERDEREYTLDDEDKRVQEAFDATSSLVEDNTIKIEYIPTDSQVADIMTKPPQKRIFQKFRTMLGMKDKSTLQRKMLG